MQVAAINATKVELLRCWPNVAALLAHASALKANSGADEISCYCKSALAILALSIRKRRHYSWWSLLRCLRFSDRAGFVIKPELLTWRHCAYRERRDHCPL